MADLDDTNAQHMAAMGLSEQPLGQPYKDRPSQEGRCASLTPAGQCARQDGHDGLHARGTVTWTTEEAESWEAEPVAPQWCHDIYSRNPKVLCDRLKGHEGAHKSGAIHWYSEDDLGPTRTRPEDQVLPTGDESIPDDQALLIVDIEARRQVGIERYGQGHRPFNGRNTLQDAYEEALDQAVYLRSLVRAREATRDELVEVVDRVVQEVVWGPDSPYIGQKPIERRVNGPLTQAVVDRLLDWATLKSADVTWALHLVDAYYRGEPIDFHSETAPLAVQAKIAEWEAKTS
jgi:hypothetical protein